MVETYFRGLAAEVREWLSRLGARSLDEIVGAAERPRPRCPEAAGSNFGSGMTGGLAYVLRGALTDSAWNREFVRLAPAGRQEQAWLRRVLREHFRLTGSPVAAALLSRMAPLPLLRVEPVQLPCSISETWAASLARLEQRDLPGSWVSEERPSEGPRLM